MDLPLTNPVLKFLVILIIILVAPIFFKKLKIPPILGLIIAGVIIGPNGFNLLLRDSSIILSGTAGLLYIMFLAGLEIDLADFRKNSFKSLVFGMYTFAVPMILGTITGLYILDFTAMSSVLLASMFASHTLIAYPILSNLGVTKNRAVNITVGGTVITDTLALLVLAVIVGMSTGEVDTFFWTRLSVSIILSGTIILLLFPLAGRWFLKRYPDSVSQYIFILAMVFLGAFLAEAAGIEPIIGAFLSGLALNRLVPATSPLMNRIEFVGNAIFIPFFLIGVGMLVDYRVFFKDLETVKVAVVMTVVATTAKYLAAWFTGKTFRFTRDEFRVMFGLSNAQAAATLAAVMVGYNVILGTAGGEPVRLLNDSVLNGTIVMILVTCTIATFSAQKGGKNMYLQEMEPIRSHDSGVAEKILIPVSNPDTIEELVSLSAILRSKDPLSGLYALHIRNYTSPGPGTETMARRLLEKAVSTASASDIPMSEILRYDSNITNGIAGVIREQNITDLVLGLHERKKISESYLGRLTEDIIARCNITTFIYKPVQPISTIRRHMVIVPSQAENVVGFPFWLSKVWNIPGNTGSKLVFYAAGPTIHRLKEIHSQHPVEATFTTFENWDDFLIISRDVKVNDCLVIVMSRINKTSYTDSMTRIPGYLNKYFQSNSFMLIYPMQMGVGDSERIDLKNPSLV